MKLISMTDFVLEIDKNDKRLNRKYYAIISYANFLKTPLNLGMFVPCDENGNVLNDPGLFPSFELEQYRKAKDKVIFPNFELTQQSTYFILTHNESGAKWLSWNKSKKVEDLVEFYVDCAVSF